MSNVIVDLLPVIVSATVVPFYIVAVLVLLQSDGGLVKTLGFVAGGVAMRLVQGLLFGLVFSAAMGGSSEDGQRLIVSTLLLVLGILLLITAFMKWQKAEDPDAPPQWMATISGLSAVRAVGAGALFVTIAVKQRGSLPCPQSASSVKLDRARQQVPVCTCSTCWPPRRSCWHPSWQPLWRHNRPSGYSRQRKAGWSGTIRR